MDSLLGLSIYDLANTFGNEAEYNASIIHWAGTACSNVPEGTTLNNDDLDDIISSLNQADSGKNGNNESDPIFDLSSPAESVGTTSSCSSMETEMYSSQEFVYPPTPHSSFFAELEEGPMHSTDHNLASIIDSLAMNVDNIIAEPIVEQTRNIALPHFDNCSTSIPTRVWSSPTLKILRQTAAIIVSYDDIRLSNLVQRPSPSKSFGSSIANDLLKVPSFKFKKSQRPKAPRPNLLRSSSFQLPVYQKPRHTRK